MITFQGLGLNNDMQYWIIWIDKELITMAVLTKKIEIDIKNIARFKEVFDSEAGVSQSAINRVKRAKENPLYRKGKE